MAAIVQEVPETRRSDDEKHLDSEKGPVTTSVSASLPPDDDAKSEDFQGGVQRVRAVTTVWDRKTMWLMFTLLYLVSFVDALITSMQYSLNPYITSEFSQHGLLTSVSIVSTILAGCSKLTLAKVIDVWGRVEGFLFMLVVLVIGMIMKAVCQDIETYFAAHTLFWYVIDVMLSDMTTLKNRMIMISINGTPTIASTFAGPAIAQLFYDNLNFRWAFGAFTIILVGVCIPVVTVMLYMQIKANKVGLIQKQCSGRKWYQSLWHYYIEFDVTGIILITAAFALFLLPFNIVHYAPYGWKSGYIIAMIILGIFSGVVFFFWERKWATVQFLPWVYLKNPTIVGSCALYAVMFLSTFCWNGYFYSYLQVVHRLEITTANYVLNCYILSSAVFSPLIGYLISRTGSFKWTAYCGVPLMLLGTALLIPLRQPSTNVGLLALTQILIGTGSAFFVTCGHLAIMVPITHQEIAVVLAIWSMFGSIGSSIGNAIAGAVWNNVFPVELELRLPEAAKSQAAAIFGDIVQQMAFEDGTLERVAVVATYAHVQRLILIAGVALMPLTVLSIWVWRGVNVKKLEAEKGKQTKGTVL